MHACALFAPSRSTAILRRADLGLAPILARTYRYPSKCLASLLEYLDLAVLALASLCHVITYVSYISTDRALPARRPGSAPHPLAPTGSSFGASGA